MMAFCVCVAYFLFLPSFFYKSAYFPFIHFKKKAEARKIKGKQESRKKTATRIA